MYFKFQYLIFESELEFVDQNGVEFELGGPHHIAVTIRPPTKQDAVRVDRKCIVAHAKSEFEPSGKVRAGFEAITQGRAPNGTQDPDGYPWSHFRRGASPAEYHFISSSLPDYMGSFVDLVRTELSEAIKSCFTAIRWRYGLWGSHDPFRNRLHGTAWSLDGATWYPLPALVELYVAPSSQVTLSRESQSNVRELVASQTKEPIGHVLFREAWGVAHENSRSAVMIAIAALEAGLKECATDLTPAAAWLLEHSPSPRIEMMLQDYLPQLPVRLLIKGKVPPPPKEILNEIRKGIQIRNIIAHRGRDSLRGDDVRGILLAVRDTLYLLDYYRGADWALEHLRPQTKAALLKNS